MRGGPGGEQILGAGKPLALLVYVALGPRRRVKRDHVAELFWPNADGRAARHSLRQIIYRLRAAVGDTDLLMADGLDLTVAPITAFDCLEAEQALNAGELSRACELLDGDFLADSSIRESREFEEWAESQRTRFREAWFRAAQGLASSFLQEGEAERVIELAEDLATRHPFDDEPVRLMMAALAAQGRHATALARYAGFAEFLHSQEEEPGPALQEYAGELQRYLHTRAVVSASGLPFVGRDQEWSFLETAWTAAEAGRGSIVLVEGAAGEGKTRILSELQRRAHASGAITLTAKCYQPEQSVPYGAVAEVFSTAADRSELARSEPAWLAEASRLLPELRQRFPDLPLVSGADGITASKRRLHQALIHFTVALANGGPVLLAVDDIHWADAVSLEVLHTLAHHVQEERVLLVASYRPAELQPAARRFARSLTGSRLARLVTLRPLSAAGVAELVDTLGRFHEPEARDQVVTQLHRQSAGNPLFLSELLDALARMKLLYVREGSWQLGSGVLLAELPSTLGKLMADRVDTLQPWMRACLEVLAVIADPVPVELLAQIVDLSEPRTELALSVLEEERLVRRGGAEGFELIHDELRGTVYHGIPDGRRRLLHAAVATALEAHGAVKRPGGAARIAYHFDQAGELKGAHRYALLAASEAGELGAEEAQREHLEVAAAHAPRALPPGAEVRARVAWRERLRRPRRAVLVTAAVTVLASVGAAEVVQRGLIPAAMATDYRQGTFYMREFRRYVPTLRVRWSSSSNQPGTIEKLPANSPDLPPMLLTRVVTEEGESHEQVYLARKRDTVRLTFASSDDMQPQWGPDHRSFLLVRGWRASKTRYQQNIFLLDSSGKVQRQLTDTPWQDSYPAWSPLGTQITFDRDSAGSSSIWIMDADGARARNLTARFGLPNAGGNPAFSADGNRLAIAYPDTGSGFGAIYLIDLGEDMARSFGGPRRGLVRDARPIWSPDGRWLVYAVGAGSQGVIWVEATQGGSAPRMVARYPLNQLYPDVWTDGQPDYAARVDVTPGRLRLAEGTGLTAAAKVFARDGTILRTDVRWSTGDSATARVDDTGFVRGRAPGSTELIASAGGFVADTVIVDVSYAKTDTLFYEDWSHGLDTLEWSYFGQPASVVVPASGAGAGPAFLSNGDYNYPSGVVSTAEFDPTKSGLTLEVPAWLAFTGGHWQIWSIAFVPGRPAHLPREMESGPIHIGFEGPSPTIPRAGWSCGSQRRDMEAGSLKNRWLRVALQVRPDGYFECVIDGKAIWRQPIPERVRGKPLSIMLLGHSVGTTIYHGPVIVTRGLRY